MDTKVENRDGGMNWEIGIDIYIYIYIYTVLCIKYLTNENLLQIFLN